MHNSISVYPLHDTWRRRTLAESLRNVSSSLKLSGRSSSRKQQTNWKAFSTSIQAITSSTWTMESTLEALRSSQNMPSITSLTWTIQTWWSTRRRRATPSRRWSTHRRPGSMHRWTSTFLEWTKPLSLNCSMTLLLVLVPISLLSVKVTLDLIKSY